MACARLDLALLRVVAEPMRAELIDLLVTEELCTCHLVEMTGAKQTNVSNHLRVLREAGVVAATPAGRYTYYRLHPEVLASLSDQFGQFAAAAAASRREPARRACP